MAPHSFIKSVLAATILAFSAVKAQEDVVLWHNRYHAVLAMAAYGDYNTNCPQQEFTEEKMRVSFPNTPYQPWEVLDEWGPTEHGAGGFTAMIPEMDKCVLVFKGDYWKEKHLSWETASLDVLGLAEDCPGCRANAYALQGYLEAKEATNGFEKAMARWRETGLWWSQTGHGLGGMHSLIAALDLGGSRNVSKFIHAYGNPRTFNTAAAAYYNRIYGGDMTEQGTANSDIFPSMIPASEDAANINTAFHYTGWNDEFKMNQVACYEAPDDSRCKPSGELNELDHYFYFTNVGDCGRTARQNRQTAANFIAAQGGTPPAVSSSSTTGSSSAASPAGSSSVSDAQSTSSTLTSDPSAATNATVTHNVLASIASNVTSTIAATSTAISIESTPSAATSIDSTDATDEGSTLSLARASSSVSKSNAPIVNAAATADAQAEGLSAATGTGAASTLGVKAAAPLLAVVAAFSLFVL